MTHDRDPLGAPDGAHYDPADRERGELPAAGPQAGALDARGAEVGRAGLGDVRFVRGRGRVMTTRVAELEAQVARLRAALEKIAQGTSLIFFVPGTPVGQQRPRCVAYRVGRSCRARAYEGHRRPGTPAAAREKAWRDALRAAIEGQAVSGGPVGLSLTFYLERPRSHFRTGRFAAELRADAPPTWDASSSPLDCSNLCKLVEDEWQGEEGLFADDRQVVRIQVWKRWCEPLEAPGLHAVINYLGEMR